MKTSGAGKKGGALIAVAGAMAIGITGCSTNSGAAKTSDAVQQAAAGVGTSTSSSSSAPAPTPTSPLSSTSATAPTSTSAASSSSTAQSSSSAPSTTHTTSTTAPPTTPKPKPTTPKPTTPTTTPTQNSGSGWLNGVPIGRNTPGKLDPRCMVGRVICIDMDTRTLLWVVDGKPQYGMDVRFGDENNPTRQGKFDIYMKMEHCISTIYHTSMPDAMFFSGGEAVHFSIDFATYGYAHHSHGCVNVRDRAAVERLFADTRVGDSVVVY